jgi:hypothetical protein
MLSLWISKNPIIFTKKCFILILGSLPIDLYLISIGQLD